MKLVETGLEGSYLLETVPIEDVRGSFARVFCAEQMRDHGLPSTISQANISTNLKAGTIRGMHFQGPPAMETKWVRCTHGAIWDVIVDFRPNSPNYLRHFAVELSAKNQRTLFVPKMFAHGFQTLTEDAEVFYLMGQTYAPGHAQGLRYDDPALGIRWPLPPTVVSQQDKNWPWIGNVVEI